MRSRLFLKVYLTLLASLAVVALAIGAYVSLGQDEQDRGWAGRRDAFLADLIPPEADPASNRYVLERLSVAFDADIALVGADGKVIATAGAPLPPGFLAASDQRRRPGPHHFSARLPDGRLLVARIGRGFGPGPGNPLGYIALIAAVTGMVAYPIVRHLTRRLENLRLGVEEWGAGALDRRVAIGGRDEVAAVAATFNQAAERVERLVESHRALLANASHELRSPLARLRMAVDMHDGAPGAQARGEIVRNLAELDELVEEILLASRLDHGGADIAREPVDLLALAAEEGARNGIAVSGAPATISGDPRLLTRLVRNLMQNALRHGAPPVTVEVAAAAGGGAELSVRDHGPGIAAAEGERVFEPFYRPRGRGEAAGGWGLGLALVRQIAERHGARVRHETPLDGGARFVVLFPS